MLGTIVMYALLAATALFVPWLLLMRTVVARQVRNGTMERTAGVASLRKLCSGLLVLVLGSVFFSAPFSPFGIANSHALAVVTMIVEVAAITVYVYLLVMMRRIGT